MINEPKRVSLIWVILAALIAVIIVFDVAYASGDIIQSNDNNAQTTGDLSLVGSRSYAFSGSLGDVDINQCMASNATNILVFGWQRLVENPTCVADGLDARGNHDAAARVRCKHVETIYSVFDDFKSCVDAVTMIPTVLYIPKVTVPDRDDERYAEQQEEIEYLREETASLVGQIQSVTRQIERRPKVQVQLAQQVDDAALRRARSRAAYVEAKKGSE